MNQFNLMGRLGADPEMRETKTGKKVVTISVGESRRKEDKTDWHRVEFWEEAAENICRYFKKGMPILIEGGRLTYDEWEKDGRKQKTATIKFARWSFCGGRDDSAHQRQTYDRRPAQTGKVGPATNPYQDDDVPF